MKFVIVTRYRVGYPQRMRLNTVCFLLFMNSLSNHYISPYKTIFRARRLNIVRDFKCTEAEFKEFEPQFKFKPRLNYDWFHLKLYQMI